MIGSWLVDAIYHLATGAYVTGNVDILNIMKIVLIPLDLKMELNQ